MPETIKQFSEFELREMGMKFAGEEAFKNAACVGTCEEELDAKVVTKSCRGIVTKKAVKGTGTGTLKITMHCPYDVYDLMFGMNLATLKDGVKAYGQNSVHKTFCITQKVLDEDDNVKFKAYPNCILEKGITRKIENGAEEVAEVELEISIMPDENGNGMYEALEEQLQDEPAKTTWMTAFTPELVQTPVL